MGAYVVKRQEERELVSDNGRSDRFRSWSPRGRETFGSSLWIKETRCCKVYMAQPLCPADISPKREKGVKLT